MANGILIPEISFIYTACVSRDPHPDRQINDTLILAGKAIVLVVIILTSYLHKRSKHQKEPCKV